MKKSIRNLVITLALLCTFAFGQNVRFDGVVSSRYGQPAGGAKIAVCSQPASTSIYPCSPLASLCTSLTDAVCASPNPVTADGLGNFHFYLLAGSTPYTVQYYGSGLTPYFVPDQIFGGGGGGGGTAQQYPNSSNGTVCNGLAKVDQTAGMATLGRATSTTGGEVVLLGVVVSACGTTGNATISFDGPVPVIFDSASATVGDAVGISNSVPGAATDLGSTNPTSSAAIIGTIILTPAGATPSACSVAPGCYIQLNLGGGGGGSGPTNAVVTNPAVTQTVTPTVPGATPIINQCGAGAAGTIACGQINDSSGSPVVQALNNDQAILGGGATKSLKSMTSSNSDFDGRLTMSGGTATYTFTGTYTTAPSCTANDETAIAAVKVTPSGTTAMVFTTSGSTDVIHYTCSAFN